MFEQVILKLTHRLWNRQISRILCRAYNDRVINSEQLHELAAAFDPTQKHRVYGRYRNEGFRHAHRNAVYQSIEAALADGEKEGSDAGQSER